MKQRILDQDTRLSLGLNMLTAVAVAIGTNLAIFLFGSQQNAVANQGFPPGWLVGSIWTVLFALLGAARWSVAISTTRQPGRTQAIAALTLFCVAYPFYTDMLTNIRIGTIGNIATVFSALAVAAFCFRSSPRVTALIVPVACWTAFASFLTLRQSSFTALTRVGGR